MTAHTDLHVVFGSGPLGLATARALVNMGRQVRIVNRRGKLPGGETGLPADTETMAADAFDPQQARRAAQGAAVVYQCAQPAYHEWVEKFPALQASILDAAALAGARLVIGDNLYMYGEVAGPICEDLPYRAHTRKGCVRAEMAEAALAAHRDGKLPVTIGRGSDFFGPGVLGSQMGERVFVPALSGKAAQAVGALDALHTYTYIDDFGRALAILGQRDEALGRAWIVPNPQTVTQRQFIEMIFGAIGRPPKISAMGIWMMRLGGLFIPEARETVEMMYEFDRPFIVDDSLFRHTFGLQPTPLQEAIENTVAWYRSHLKQ